MVKDEKRTVPKSSLAYLFPGGFNEFWTKTAIRQDLEQIIYEYVPATETTEELRKTLASGGYGLLARPIVKHYFDRYQYSTFEPYEDVFMAKFKTNVINVVIEVRQKQYLWQDTFRQIKSFVKPLKLTTDTRTSKNYDNTKIDSGNIINRGSNTNQTSEQKQINSQSAPIFANVDLTSGAFGGFQRQQQLSNKQTEQGQNIQAGSFNRTTSKQNLTQKEFYRQNKDANVQITKQDASELASVGKLLNNFLATVIKLSDYYPLFDKLFIKMFGATVVPIIDEKTGKRKWVSEAEYEELVEPEETAKPKIIEGNEWDETLTYLERLKILLNKQEKEYSKLPDTSNRKPRIALRIQIAEGALKAYSKEDLNLPSAEEFRARVNGEVEGFQKIIGHQNILKMIEIWLEGWDFYKEYGGDKPEQLMLALSGPPGLGKTYISQALAKALNRGFHIISMNGKQSASIVYGTDISNPGAEAGEIVKAISKKEDRACLILFDELEKAGKDAKRAIANPTDRTINKDFKDDFFDFPTPANECIFLVAINYPEDLPDFVGDRFRVIDTLPLPYEERLEVLRLLLRSKLKSLDNAFQKIYGKKWEVIYSLFDNKELLKKVLTRTFSIRGAKDNIILSLIPVLIADFLKRKKPLPNEYELIDYDWKFIKKEDLDKGDADRKRPPCPFSASRDNEHRKNCECFLANLEKVPGWAENMEQEY